MQTYLENGELRGIIIGTDPSIDSPAIYIETTRRHYAVIRMRYYGEATEAHLLCKGGSDQTSSSHLDAKNSYWQFRHNLRIYSSSSGNTSVHNLVDTSPYTKWITNRAFSEYVVLDLRDVRWINKMIVQSDGTSSSPRNCILQSSISTGAGPYTTVVTFQLSQVLLKFRSSSPFFSLNQFFRF